jgi:hypothetical protein
MAWGAHGKQPCIGVAGVMVQMGNRQGIPPPLRSGQMLGWVPRADTLPHALLAYPTRLVLDRPGDLFPIGRVFLAIKWHYSPLSPRGTPGKSRILRLSLTAFSRTARLSCGDNSSTIALAIGSPGPEVAIRVKNDDSNWSPLRLVIVEPPFSFKYTMLLTP